MSTSWTSRIATWCAPAALVLLVVAAVAMVACGGGGAEDRGATVAEGPGAMPDGINDEPAEDDDDNGDASGDGGSGDGRGFVTIGDEEFELDNSGRCVTIGGQVSGGASAHNGSVDVSFTIPPEDWETNEHFNNPPTISVIDRRSEPNLQWTARANPNLPAEEAPGVDSYTSEGGRAYGEATFRSAPLTGPADPADQAVGGTFDFDCGD
jgi:hypothetical protein